MVAKLELAILLVSQICLAFCEPSWETLRVTWGLPTTKSGVFDPMPLTEDQALEQGYQLINDNCVHGEFLGYRYLKNNDPSVILIYDTTGYVAGIQSALPKDQMDQIKTVINPKNSKAHRTENIAGKNYYVQTAYFIKPSRICKGGRSQEEFQKDIGTDLYFQNGPKPLTDVTRIPKFQGDIERTKWTKGGCFPSMGLHYWYDMSTDKDCKDFYQAFLLYNKGKLTAFGFANPGLFNNPRFEHPNKPILAHLIQPYPTCLDHEFDIGDGFSSMHIYFNVREDNLKC